MTKFIKKETITFTYDDIKKENSGRKRVSIYKSNFTNIKRNTK